MTDAEMEYFDENTIAEAGLDPDGNEAHYIRYLGASRRAVDARFPSVPDASKKIAYEKSLEAFEKCLGEARKQEAAGLDVPEEGIVYNVHRVPDDCTGILEAHFTTYCGHFGLKCNVEVEPEPGDDGNVRLVKLTTVTTTRSDDCPVSRIIDFSERPPIPEIPE